MGLGSVLVEFMSGLVLVAWVTSAGAKRLKSLVLVLVF